MAIIADKFLFSSGQSLLGTPASVHEKKTLGLTSTASAKLYVKRLRPKLLDAQTRLFANQQHSLLVVLQGMDTSGKDGLVRHIFRHVNPVGLLVSSFGPPEGRERREHFLARYRRSTPPAGYVGVFNRSYYEQLMYLRVHPEQRVSPISDDEEKSELFSIREFEKELLREKVKILKVFLHVSEEEQRQRLLGRANNPKKSWKLQRADLVDRRLWAEHYCAFQRAMAETHVAWAPWYVVPADDKWVARYIVANIVLDTLEALAPSYPQPDKALQILIEDVRRELG